MRLFGLPVWGVLSKGILRQNERGLAMSEPKATCAVLFGEAWRAYSPDITDGEFRAFVTGFAAGQMEKLTLGACASAMFRPSSAYRDWHRGIIGRLAALSGLCVTEIVVDDDVEIWAYRPEYEYTLTQLKETEPNSPQWHTLRGALCGVPIRDIDEKFHERVGYGKHYERPIE